MLKRLSLGALGVMSLSVASSAVAQCPAGPPDFAFPYVPRAAMWQVQPGIGALVTEYYVNGPTGVCVTGVLGTERWFPTNAAPVASGFSVTYAFLYGAALGWEELIVQDANDQFYNIVSALPWGPFTMTMFTDPPNAQYDVVPPVVWAGIGVRDVAPGGKWLRWQDAAGTFEVSGGIRTAIAASPPQGVPLAPIAAGPVYARGDSSSGERATGSVVNIHSVAPENASVPTVSEWGLIIMTLLFLAAGTIVVGRLRGNAMARRAA